MHKQSLHFSSWKKALRKMDQIISIRNGAFEALWAEGFFLTFIGDVHKSFYYKQKRAPIICYKLQLLQNFVKGKA